MSPIINPYWNKNKCFKKSLISPNHKALACNYNLVSNTKRIQREISLLINFNVFQFLTRYWM